MATNAEDEKIEQFGRNVENCHCIDEPIWTRWTDEPIKYVTNGQKRVLSMIKNGDEVMMNKVWGIMTKECIWNVK